MCESELEHWVYEQGVGRAFIQAQMNLAGLFALIDGFDGPGPGCTVAVVDYA